MSVITAIFGNETVRRGLFKLRFILGLALMFPVARFMRPELFWIGFAVSMLGQVIQTWCFASLVKNRELTIRGPYLLARNPMYLGRYFMILGFVILLGNVWIALAYTVLYYLYMDNRVKREEKRLRIMHTDAYAAYCNEVPRFFPSFRKAGDPKLWYWDWGPFVENNAHWNLLGTLICYGFVYGIWHALWQ